MTAREVQKTPFFKVLGKEYYLDSILLAEPKKSYLHIERIFLTFELFTGRGPFTKYVTHLGGGGVYKPI